MIRKLLAKTGIDYRDYIPKSVICLREGYSKKFFFNDLFAGMTVGIITIPLAMAFAIASGVPPERGLFTAIVAGFLISLLGGSRVQIGGPTGAFVVIVYSVVQRHGYEGLAVATVMAGIMMILMGLARFGVILKFIPYPVTTGFTSGIALVIFSSQVKDFFGLDIATLPADFISKWKLFFASASTWNSFATSLGFLGLGIIFFFRRRYPKIPGAIIAVIVLTALAALAHFPVETVGSKFKEISRTLPAPSFPLFSFENIQRMFPDAITIALLGAIESLLSAVVADGMTGHRHRSNCELVAQGFANIGSIIFGGIPATGAIARTTANIKMHAKTPLAGMIHAITVLLLMLFFAPWVSLVPLAALAAVLMFVAWNMSELDHFFEILKGQKSDAAVLIITFLATILIDLTVAVQLGVLLAALLFLKRMSDSTTGAICGMVLEENQHDYSLVPDSDLNLRTDVPPGVTLFEIDGPFFFPVSGLLMEALAQLDSTTKVFILKMNKIPVIDSTGINALKQFQKKCEQRGIVLLMSGVRETLQPVLKKTGVEAQIGSDHFFSRLSFALSYVRLNTNSRK